MALSPLGKRRSGGSVAAMASQTRHGEAIACFASQWNPVLAKSARKFNKLIGWLAISRRYPSKAATPLQGHAIPLATPPQRYPHLTSPARLARCACHFPSQSEPLF